MERDSLDTIGITRTFDYSLIRSVITHPKIYPLASDDFSPTPDDFWPVEGEHIWYLLAKQAGHLYGLFALAPHNAVCWEVHTCLLPIAWGSAAREAAMAAIVWAWNNSPCQRLITNVPAYNRLALRFAENAGLKRFGVNERSYMKNGRLHDQIMLGISKCQ